MKDGFYQLKIRGVDDVLYVSEQANIHSLYQTITEQMYSRAWHFYEVPETEVKDDVVIDAGCAEGIFPYLCKGRARQIYAFEPLPVFLDGLNKTFGNIPNVHIVSAALGSQCADAYLESNGISSYITDRETPTKVKMLTIDQFCSENGVIPTYLKADLEGYELELLNGAQSVIQRFKPKIAITTYHRPEHADAIKNKLACWNPSYQFRIKGIESVAGAPIMLHAW